ncbi:MerR family transcriptional regulator [Brachybacterium sp. AOP43-C2-M15]|uniref:MerR family transcriptional regulator n=1 Tax=Brachybacterium sp. AOP43-C2-M15 TaxID=3457661 RepID=UPI004033DF75
MQLSELAEAGGVSTASIKYYRREGLLPAGRRVTATRQEYGRAHLERLALIQVLREVAGASIARIARLTAILDDPDRTLLDALESAQEISIGLDGSGTDEASEEAVGRSEHPSILPLLEHLGWPDVDSAPRRALDELLRSLEGWGIPIGPDVLHRYAEPMAEIARADVDSIRELPSDRDGDGAGGGEGIAVSDDVQVMRAVAGAIAFDRMVRLLRALGHASYSVLGAELSAAGRSRTPDGSGRPHAG